MKQLAKKLKKLLNNPLILDVIIFGSFVKNKLNVNDIDIAIIAKEDMDKGPLINEVKKITKKKVDMQIITVYDYDKSLWITLIKEGFSVKHNKFLYEVYRIQPIVLYKYSLKPLSASKKVMFERAIKTFDGVKRLSNRVVLVPIFKSGEFSDFLKLWDLDIEAEEFGLLPFLRKENFMV